MPSRFTKNEQRCIEKKRFHKTGDSACTDSDLTSSGCPQAEMSCIKSILFRNFPPPPQAEGHLPCEGAGSMKVQ